MHEVVNLGLDKGFDKGGAGLKENDHAVEVLTSTSATDNAATRRDLIAMVDRRLIELIAARIENYESVGWSSRGYHFCDVFFILDLSCSTIPII